jgi:hypothetical protein
MTAEAMRDEGPDLNVVSDTLPGVCGVCVCVCSYCMKAIRNLCHVEKENHQLFRRKGLPHDYHTFFEKYSISH